MLLRLIDAFITVVRPQADGLLAEGPGMVLESLEEFNKSLALFDRWIARMSNLRAAAK